MHEANMESRHGQGAHGGLTRLGRKRAPCRGLGGVIARPVVFLGFDVRVPSFGRMMIISVKESTSY